MKGDLDLEDRGRGVGAAARHRRQRRCWHDRRRHDLLSSTVNSQSLRALFAQLHGDAEQLAQEAFAGAASPAPAHSCAYLVAGAYSFHGLKPPKHPPPAPPGWPGSWRQHWHLPEPFIGEVVDAQPLVAFVGLNPSIDWREPCPARGTSIGDWLAFWRNGFDANGRLTVAGPGGVPLYGEYQSILRCALGRSATLGRDAIVTDAVHFKAWSPGPWLLLRPALAHAVSVPLTVEFLKALAVPVVVTVGRESTRHVGAAFCPSLATETIRNVHGRAFAAAGVTIVPALHRNARHYPAAMRLPVAQAIARALGRPLPTCYP